MREFLDRLAAHVHWVVFIILEILSGIMLFQFNHYQNSVWLTQANAAAGKVLEWEAKGLSFIKLRELNRQLTEQNIALQQELDLLRRQLTDLQKDSSYTERVLARQTSEMQLIPAQVIANSVRKKDNFITINKGTSDGVKTEMGVISGTGVVGIVCKVSSHFAVILPILNSQSSISCRLRGTEYFGYLKWEGGNPLQAQIDDIPRHAHFKVGDIVETSGFSSVFPPGIFVGRIAQIHDSADGLAYQLEVQLATDLANIRDVAVVAQEKKEELEEIQQDQPTEKKRNKK